MSQRLEDIFAELGLSQYLNLFVDQGFDSWETILDITESDLDVLGVKLGHRRKLQRRIANTRGLAPSVSLVLPTKQTVEDLRGDTQRHHVSRPDSPRVTAVIITKRKYRRHPKPDENAPERPPSAYVLFSNKMRDELKGRNLTFTEIAKLVGENWQSLSHLEKEPYEGQAQTAKDKYNRDLSEYKRTAEYTKYMGYLQEFKAKHAGQKSDKEAAKRVKLSGNRVGFSPGLRGPARTSGTSRSNSESDDERPGSSEPPDSGQWRLGSRGAAAADSMYSPAITPVPQRAAAASDASLRSPSTATMSRDQGPIVRSPASTGFTHRDGTSASHDRQPSWPEMHRTGESGPPRPLPSRADVLDYRAMGSAGASTTGMEVQGFPFPYNRGSRSPGSTPSLVGGESRAPSLRREQSTADSVSSVATSSVGTSWSHPRTPLEGPLPIHALLAGRPSPVPEGAVVAGYPPSADGKHPYSPPLLERSSTDYSMNGHVALPLPGAVQGLNPVLPGASSQLVSPPTLPTTSSCGNTAYSTPTLRGMSGIATPQATGSGRGLDGMSALLRAGEIVGRRPP